MRGKFRSVCRAMAGPIRRPRLQAAWLAFLHCKLVEGSWRLHWRRGHNVSCVRLCFLELFKWM